MLSILKASNKSWTIYAQCLISENVWFLKNSTEDSDEGLCRTAVVNVMTQPAGQQRLQSIVNFQLVYLFGSGSLLLTYLVARKEQRAAKPEISKLSNFSKTSKSLVFTLPDRGSRGLDGAIGNLFRQRGIMCRICTVFHNIANLSVLPKLYSI